MKTIDVGRRILDLRKKAGISQMDLELKIGASYGSLSRIESGKVNPTKETMLKIIEELDLPPYQAAYLFGVDINKISKLLELPKTVFNTLELEQVLQNSVNDICYELNFIGAFLVLVRGKRIYAQTATQKWYIKKVFKVIEVPFQNLYCSLEKDKSNLMVRCVNERKVFVSDNVSDFIVPAVSSTISEIIKKISGPKSSIVLPIIYQEKVLGAILFSRNVIDNFEIEKPVLKAFTDNLAVAIANAQKYEILKDEIKKLKESTK